MEAPKQLLGGPGVLPCLTCPSVVNPPWSTSPCPLPPIPTFFLDLSLLPPHHPPTTPPNQPLNAHSLSHPCLTAASGLSRSSWCLSRWRTRCSPLTTCPPPCPRCNGSPGTPLTLPPSSPRCCWGRGSMLLWSWAMPLWPSPSTTSGRRPALGSHPSRQPSSRRLQQRRRRQQQGGSSSRMALGSRVGPPLQQRRQGQQPAAAAARMWLLNKARMRPKSKSMRSAPNRIWSPRLPRCCSSSRRPASPADRQQQQQQQRQRQAAPAPAGAAATRQPAVSRTAAGREGLAPGAPPAGYMPGCCCCLGGVR
jgi:hypothetical protein